jgi:hypothetical protein
MIECGVSAIRIDAQSIKVRLDGLEQLTRLNMVTAELVSPRFYFSSPSGHTEQEQSVY